MATRKQIREFKEWTPLDFSIWKNETIELMNQLKRIHQKIITLSMRFSK